MLEQNAPAIAILAGMLVAVSVGGFGKRLCESSFFPKEIIDSINSKIRRSGSFTIIGPFKLKSVSQLVMFQVTSIICLVFATTFFATPIHPAVLLPAAIAISFYAPIVRLNREIEKRRKKILSELPGVMEIIAMVMEAGLSFDSAVVNIAEQRSGLIASLFKRATSEISTGIKRETAYKKVAEIGSSELKSFINTVLIAEAQGRPVKQTIIDMARTFREQQKNEIEAEANKLPTTMLIPIFVCIVPPILLVYLLPALQNLEVLFG